MALVDSLRPENVSRPGESIGWTLLSDENFSQFPPETIPKGCSSSSLSVPYRSNRMFIISEGHHNILPERMNHYERAKSLSGMDLSTAIILPVL